MTRVIRSSGCGNSPKNALVVDMTVARITGDVDFFGEHVVDDIHWERPGLSPASGWNRVSRLLSQAGKKPPSEVTLLLVSSHGRTGAVNGWAVSADGKRRDFCDVYEFANAKGTQIKSITSYEIASKG